MQTAETTSRRSLPRRVVGRLRRLVRSRVVRPRPPAPPPAAAAAPSPPRARRPAPPAPVETTFLGPVMDQRVAVARGQLRPRGEDADYDLVRDNFDVIHYLLQSPRVADLPSTDLVEHFLENSVALRKSPGPDFSMSGYLTRYPERAASSQNPYVAWLRHGRDAGELADPAAGITDLAPLLGMEQDEVVEQVRQRRSDLLQRLRTGVLGEMFAKAAEIEPLIGEAWRETTSPRMIPFTRPLVAAQAAALYAAQQAAGFRRARIVIAVNRPRWGGGRRIEGHIAHALTEHIAADDIVVVYTDTSGERPDDRFPAGVREVDFAALTAALPPEEAQTTLVTLLRTFVADAVVNINSRTLYLAQASYGRALAASERVFLCFFCNEQSPLGVWFGYSQRYLYRAFDEVAGVITDSRTMADDLVATYKLTGPALAKMHVFRAPVDARLPVVPTSPPGGGRPQVFWAGRWDRQKRLDLLLEIAKRMPDVDFRMWGEPVMGGPDPGSGLPNVLVQGRYAHISDLPLSEADVWLYTSGWDGVPSQLLEVSMTGVPIVGTLVGGTGEVMSDEDAWPVPLEAGAEAYETAIRSVLADPADARRRALSLRERMLSERTLEAYAETAAAVLLLDDREEER